VHVEDHPVEYFDFEGIIPKGEYGGGDVIVWDWGTWQPAETGDPARAIERGELHFDLHGEKLAGRVVFIRRDEARPAKEQWLLIHKNDDHARTVGTLRTTPYRSKAGVPTMRWPRLPRRVWCSDKPAGDATVALTQEPRAPLAPRWL
jgi:bifunctional non-homologous end joining protein LigD